MKKISLFLSICLCVVFLGACGGGASGDGAASGGKAKLDDQAAFLESYNKAAAEVGATQLTEDDIGPYTENQEEKEGFIVNDGVLEADLFSFSPGNVMLSGRPDDFDRFYLESEAVLMACTGIDKAAADELIDEIYFAKDATVREQFGGDVVEKELEKNGVQISVSSVSGIILLDFRVK